MDWLHKILTFLTNPLTLGLAGLLVVSCWSLVVRRKQSKSRVEVEERRKNHHFIPILYTFFILWLWTWSTPLMTRWIGLPLERGYPPIAAENYPEADAICLLGGGMSCWEPVANSTLRLRLSTSTNSLSEMWLSADRVWMAAKLWKAGKAKMITITGNDAWKSTMPLLQDFGVPTNAVVLIEDAKNTEDEAALIAEAMRESKSRVEVEERNLSIHSSTSTSNFDSSPVKPRVLLVTSAWHMRRAEWLFKRAGLEVIPAACDYEVSARHAGKKIGASDFLPDAEVLCRNSYLWKEWFAYWCYRVRDGSLRLKVESRREKVEVESRSRRME